MMKIIIWSAIIVVYFASEIRCQTISFYEIDRLPFTSNYTDDFSPVFFRNGLVFTSNPKKGGSLFSRLTNEGESPFNIFYAGQNKTGKWDTPGIFSASLRSNYHDGPVSFSSNGSRIYFTRNIPGRKSEVSRLGIYHADYSNGEWVNIMPFPHNGTNYNVSHPSISSDGKTLYFTSDMPGGYGGSDIYMSVLEGQGWSAPINLGENINSVKDEAFPYIHPGGRLYYSSRNNADEVFDLYYSIYNGMWQTPVRLPEPFNTKADDFGFIADDDLKTGYFSSSREGRDNIYSFISTFPEFTRCNSMKEPELCYVFYESRGDDLDTLLSYYLWDMGDGTKIRGREADHCFSKIGNYIVSLDVINLLTGEITHNQATYHFNIERIEQAFISSPDTCYVDQTIWLDASETWLRNFVIDEYYWDLGDGSKSKGEAIYHKFGKPGIYDVRLGVFSDPDSPFGQQSNCVYKQIVVIENNL
jgi:hypothetical protein